MARFGTLVSYVPYAHYNCQCNQIVAISNRVIGMVPTPTTEGLKLLRNIATKFTNLMSPTQPGGWYDMANSYRGGKKARYVDATDQVLARGLLKKHSRVQLFVKWEKKRFIPSKPNPDPRAIQFRDPRYCVVLGKYLKPMEHKIYKVKGRGKFFPPSRMIGKGLSTNQRARLLAEKFKGFDDPRVVSLDCSRFDQHVSGQLLQIEHQVYLGLCNDPTFAQVLSWQLVNRGATKQGIKYICHGARMSGDMNTALGNCILMIIMVVAFITQRTSKFDVLDDGDDCLLLIEADDLPWVVENAYTIFLSFGMEIKVESIAARMEDVEWCQCKPVMTGGGWKFVRRPEKVLNGSACGLKYLDPSLRLRRKLLRSIGMTELILNQGVPILQAYALAILRVAGPGEALQFDTTDEMYHKLDVELRARGEKLEDAKARPVTDEARASFALAFGFAPAEQVELEQQLSEFTFSLTGDQDAEPEIDVDKWILNYVKGTELYVAKGYGSQEETN